MSYELRSPVENFLNWESNKGKETFLIQPINGKNYEFSKRMPGFRAMIEKPCQIYTLVRKSGFGN